MSLCITTVVDKNYMAYLPLFVYCVNKAYPEYHVKLFLRDKCDYNLNKWRLNCELVPLFEDYPRYEYMSIALRFAVDREHYKDFNSVYITDIDMMIMRESKTIEYFHEMERCKTQLCYSNSLRNAMHYAGSESLTGLHYATTEWFERTNDITAFYRDLLYDGILGTYREYDGVMLYRIADKSGCGLPGKYKLTNRHHGIHLGNFRLFGNNKLKLDTRMPIDFRVKWLHHLGNRTFQDICETCRVDNDDLNNHLKNLELFCKGQLC